MHVVAPIERRHEWPKVKAFAKTVSERLAADAPGRYLTRISKAERRGRIFIDYLRNDPTSTSVAPYSTRSREGAPVSTPIAWEELTPSLDPASFDIVTVPERFLTRISKAERRGRIFIDYLRNDPTSTAVAPYSTRARAGAPVAMPIAWDDLSASLDPAAFNINTVPGYLRERPADPWAEIGKLAQRLPA